MKNGICPKCRSNKIISKARVIDRTYGATFDLTIEVTEKPHAVFRKEKSQHTLRAFVCGECGYSELYAEDPKGLWLSHERSQSDKA